MDSMSFNRQPFLVAIEKVTVVRSKPGLSSHCQKELHWLYKNMRLSYIQTVV